MGSPLSYILLSSPRAAAGGAQVEEHACPAARVAAAAAALERRQEVVVDQRGVVVPVAVPCGLAVRGTWSGLSFVEFSVRFGSLYEVSRHPWPSLKYKGG